jgi:hypothetical protein
MQGIPASCAVCHGPGEARCLTSPSSRLTSRKRGNPNQLPSADPEFDNSRRTAYSQNNVYQVYSFYSLRKLILSFLFGS